MRASVSLNSFSPRIGRYSQETGTSTQSAATPCEPKVRSAAVVVNVTTLPFRTAPLSRREDVPAALAESARNGFTNGADHVAVVADQDERALVAALHREGLFEALGAFAGLFVLSAVPAGRQLDADLHAGRCRGRPRIHPRHHRAASRGNAEAAGPACVDVLRIDAQAAAPHLAGAGHAALQLGAAVLSAGAKW